ncbi:MAG: hypothetical protein V7K32_02835 [Nostoc sp.]
MGKQVGGCGDEQGAGEAGEAEEAGEAGEAGEVICINYFVKWYDYPET